MVEAGLTVTVLALLAMGIIEFGRAWMVGNMITQAAREGARIAAVAPPAFRTGGLINSAYVTGTIQPQVRGQIANVLDSTTANSFTVSLAQPTTGGINEVQITVSGSVPYIFNLGGTSFNVNRVVTFRDEVR
jgi:Flp pilus assembly protein TadG